MTAGEVGLQGDAYENTMTLPRNAFGREPRKENKKTHRKLKKPGDDAAAVLAAAATSKEQEKKVKEEETKKHVPVRKEMEGVQENSSGEDKGRVSKGRRNR